MIHIEFDLGKEHPVSAGTLRHAAQVVLNMNGNTKAELTVVLTGDERIQALNLEFLGIPSPTDVLSFPADEADPESGVRYLGDVIISVERAALQAQAGGHALGDEIMLLVVHGVLHLLGHDHADTRQKSRMWAAQQAALEKLGLPASIVHE